MPKSNVSDEIIQKLESSKENLSSMDEPRKIIEEIRKIMSLKDQFELTKNQDLNPEYYKLKKLFLNFPEVDGVDEVAFVRCKRYSSEALNRI